MSKPTLKNVSFLAFILIASTNLFAQSVNQTFNTAGVHLFTVPAGYSSVVRIGTWGAGGGGGGVFASRGAGGGGGAFATKTLSLEAGTYTVIVGKGGKGAIYNNLTSGTPAMDGENTSFGSIVFANGGKAGSIEDGGLGGAASTGQGYTSCSGGNGGNTALGFVNGAGGGGSGNASAVVVNGGNGGNSLANNGGYGGFGQGIGGIGGSSSIIPGNGLFPGGGGGGKNEAYGTSGNGADGLVIVTVLSNTNLSASFGPIQAQVIGNKAVLNFTTLDETNNDHFNIQASKDGVKFETIQTIQSKHADGNASDITNYSISLDLNGKFALGFSMAALLGLGVLGFKNKRSRILMAMLSLGILSFTMHSCSKDAEANKVSIEGKTFIRIQQVDKDGAASYSKVITVFKN